VCVVGARRRERLPSVVCDSECGRKRREHVEGLRFIGKQRVRIPAHREIDVAVPGQPLGQLRMHAPLCDKGDVAVAKRVEVCEPARRIDIGDSSGL